MVNEGADGSAATGNRRRCETVVDARFEPGELAEDRFLRREADLRAGAITEVVARVEHRDVAERNGPCAAEAVLLLGVGHVDAGGMNP